MTNSIRFKFTIFGLHFGNSSLASWFTLLALPQTIRKRKQTKKEQGKVEQIDAM